MLSAQNPVHKAKASKLNKLFEEEIAPRMASMEPERVRARKIIIASIVPGSLILILAYASSGNSGFNPLTIGLALLASGAIFAWGISVFKNYANFFKAHVVEKMVESMFPGFDFRAERSIGQDVYTTSQLFLRDVDSYEGEDFVCGKIGETEFQFSELHTQYKTTRIDSKGRRRTTWHTIFRGIFFCCDFNKHTQFRTFIFPDEAESLFGGFLTGVMQKAGSVFSSHGDLVKLENPEFERYFAVYADDQQEARYILTPVFMEKLYHLKIRLKRTPFVSFIDGHIYIALNDRGNNFEPRLFGESVRFSDVEAFYQTVQSIIAIIDELQLNLRLWSKN